MRRSLACRRHSGIHLAIVLIAAVARMVSAAEAPQPPQGDVAGGSDWPRFLGPDGNGKSPEKGLLSDWGPHGPPVVWHCKLGTSYGIGSVAAGRFFQFDRYGDQVRLTCLDAQTGKFRWKFEYPTDYQDRVGYNNGPRCSPVIDQGRVYLYGAEGMLHCLSADDGKLLWKVDTARQFAVVQNFFGVGSTPVVYGDLLLTMVGGSPAESPVGESEKGDRSNLPVGPKGAAHKVDPSPFSPTRGVGRFEMDRVRSNGSALVAFDKRTGAVKYASGDELASYAAPQLAHIGGRDWCFLFARDGLLALDPGTGKVAFDYPWRARLHDSVNASTPVVVGDEVFISETYGPGSSLLRVSADGYRIVWRDPAGRDKALQCHWNTPIYHQGFLYGCSGRHPGEAELRCIEWQTGKVRWRQPGMGLASLLYVDGHFVYLAEDGTLRLIKATPERYVELSKAVPRETPDGPALIKPPAWAAPILAHGLLYLRGDDRLVCLRLLH